MKVAIITGAGSGIGLGTARKLAGAGMSIVGTGRDAEKLAELPGAVGDAARVATVAVDLMDEDAPRRIVAAALERFGRIDFLINNAGVGRPKPVHEADDETLDHVLGLMLRAPFRLIREVLPHLRRGAGIVNVTSTYAVIGGWRGGAYSAAKAGMTGLTQHLACQYGPQGIRSNAVAPGVIPTPMTEGRFEDETFRRMNNDVTPYPRLGEVEDIASTIAFLCSPGAEFINGQTIAVDGGWSSTKYLSEYALTSAWTPERP
ncbi:SDR family oxidoreductase [Sandaracinobacter sp. RS1-74]|uniref:SDR family NAD(P)-dependent oxidoreductase n=1 Tax=Sandaracinobacteroides sayramensis TaxID=2913411 RepID=UPI001EDBF95D|nr:SDR family oxidoreductase [Sandaracinobacteroides sayramensis]MCG2842022.1 SDR family oxidoreductase [Sandaracinobacteroides sayramensis]